MSHLIVVVVVVVDGEGLRHFLADRLDFLGDLLHKFGFVGLIVRREVVVPRNQGGIPEQKSKKKVKKNK